MSIEQQESGLVRQLSVRQLTMIAIGGAIGTGLFLGSALAVRLAGPAVILTYMIGAVVALLLMGALSEMAVAHPTAGSFGVYAELYVNRWAGFVVRYTYWACQVIAIGGEATAVAIYCQWWLPQVPQAVWIVAFSVALIAVNALSVANFGEFEYWFAMIKVVAIVLFIVFGISALAGIGPAPAIGLKNYTAQGGFVPHGWIGVWLAIVFVIFSYLGSEAIAVTAGEAKDPQTAVPKALRSMVSRLTIFYMGAIILLMGIVPWKDIQPGADITASPFVKVFELMGIPAAAHLINFVVLTAALSSMNCNLYLVSRTLFSLSRSGFAPAAWGTVTRRGVPLNALLISSVGLAIATGVAIRSQQAYLILFGVALFGGLFVWLMIFVTHLRFRSMWEASGGAKLPVRMWGYPYLTILGVLLMVAIMATTWFVEGMRVCLQSGAAWLVLISVAYWLRTRGGNGATSPAHAPKSSER